VEKCEFCEIVAGKDEGQIIFQDREVTAFRDIHPAAPTHVLIVPNRHIATINDITENDESLLGHMFVIAHQLAKDEGVANSGYRLVINNGPDAGQMVFHIHLHLLGGHRLGPLSR
jgi:histidine triad (HIT) family protein